MHLVGAGRVESKIQLCPVDDEFFPWVSSKKAGSSFGGA